MAAGPVDAWKIVEGRSPRTGTFYYTPSLNRIPVPDRRVQCRAPPRWLRLAGSDGLKSHLPMEHPKPLPKPQPFQGPKRADVGRIFEPGALKKGGQTTGQHRQVHTASTHRF